MGVEVEAAVEAEAVVDDEIAAVGAGSEARVGVGSLGVVEPGDGVHHQLRSDVVAFE